MKRVPDCVPEILKTTLEYSSQKGPKLRELNIRAGHPVLLQLLPPFPRQGSTFWILPGVWVCTTTAARVSGV